jgi:hypothetical protein
MLIALLTPLLLGSALAADPGDDPLLDVEPAPEIRYKAKTEIDFGERKVDGAVSGPLGVYSQSLADRQWNPLIRLKRDFDREILASVETVR